MTVRDDLRAEIERRRGTWKSKWTEKRLQEEIAKLPEPEEKPRGRRAAAEDADKRRRSEQPLEQPSPKKLKPLEKLVAGNTGASEPSKALLKACEALLAKHGKPPRKEGDLITSSELWATVKREYNVIGTGGCRIRTALSNATFELAKRYGRLNGDEKKTSPLRWLDASQQIRRGGRRTEAQKKKEKEVEDLAPIVAKAVDEGRVEPIIHEMGTKNGVALPGPTIGLHAESKVGEKLRAATVGDAMRWRYAPPWMTRRQVAALWRVFAKVPLSMPLYDIVEGPNGGFGLPRVDLWLALHYVLAALAAQEPEFASLNAVLDYMFPVHVKTLTATFGPGGGEYVDVPLTSAVEQNARRLRIQCSSIECGAGALVRSGGHIYAPPDATPDQLPRPNEGLRINVAPTMKGGSFDVAAPIIGPTVSEPVDFGGNSRAMTCYTPAGAKDGHSFGDGLDVRNADMFARDNAWDHELAAAVMAAALNVGNFAGASSWVHRDALRLAPPPFIREQYQPSKQVEFSEIMSVGIAVELATNCAIVPSDVRLERDLKRTHDSVLVASPDASVPLLRENDAKMEWKALTFDNESLKVVHGDEAIRGDARYCCLAIGTDLGRGSSAIRAEDAPFCEENVRETLDMVHELLNALDVSRKREKTFADFLEKSPLLKRTRLVICSISDLDKAGVAPEKYVRRVSFDAAWPRVRADIQAALTYCLGRLDKWRKATPPAWETKWDGPREPTGDPLKLVPPTGEGIAADITTRAAAPPALKRKAGLGGLAPVPPPPKLHPSEPRPTPWASAARTGAPAEHPRAAEADRLLQYATDTPFFDEWSDRLDDMTPADLNKLRRHIDEKEEQSRKRPRK